MSGTDSGKNQKDLVRQTFERLGKFVVTVERVCT